MTLHSNDQPNRTLEDDYRKGIINTMTYKSNATVTPGNDRGKIVFQSNLEDQQSAMNDDNRPGTTATAAVKKQMTPLEMAKQISGRLSTQATVSQVS